MQAEKLGNTVLVVLSSRTEIFAHDFFSCHRVVCWLLLPLVELPGFLTDLEQCSTIFGTGCIFYHERSYRARPAARQLVL